MIGAPTLTAFVRGRLNVLGLSLLLTLSHSRLCFAAQTMFDISLQRSHKISGQNFICRH